MSEASSFLLGKRYRLDAEIGRGGMAVVYRGHDTLLERHVAVKILSKATLDSESRARLLREAQAAAQLNHPNIASVYDAGEAEGVPFIVMELVEGPSLYDQPPGDLEEIVDLACQVCAALDHAHAHGIVHRDLKPENVLLAPGGTAKLVDFGLARTVASRLTTEGAILGTLLYMAPEQAQGGEIDGRADLYALGVMLYEWTTGHLPFEDTSPVVILAHHLHTPVVPPREHNDEIPPALDALIVQLLSKRSEERPASAAEVRQALEALTEPASLPEPSGERVRLPRFLLDEGEEPVDQRPAFVARELELAWLRGFLQEALEGRGRVVFVTGGPGRGKTALLDGFAKQAMDEHPDLLVATGTCEAYSGVGDPYLPFREVLGLLTGEVEARWAASAISHDQARRLWRAMPVAVEALLAHGPHVVPALVPGEALLARASDACPTEPWLGRLRERVELRPAAADRLEQSHLFQQVSNVLHALAEVHPLMLILDDLQWVDRASAGLLFHLGRRLESARILIAGAYRPEEVALGLEERQTGEREPHSRPPERHPLEKMLAEFKRIFGDVWLDLAEVAESEGRRFVDAFLETEPNCLGEGFRQALFERVEGHPLFTIELLRAMQERGDLVRDEAGRWVEGSALDWETLPARVEGVIAERIERLGEELREILTVASVEGEDFTAEVVAQVQAIEARELVRRLSGELQKEHRLVRARGLRWLDARRLALYRFQHHLFQKYLYNNLDEAERVYLHGDVGTVLEELYGEQAEELAVQLARHFHFAGDLDREAYYARLAGERAAARHANAEALRYFSRALELTPETREAERYILLLAREKVYDLLGEREPQARDLAALQERAGALNDAQKQAEVSLRQSHYARMTSDYRAAAEAARQGVALAQEAEDAAGEAWGQLAWARALLRQGDYDATTDHLSRGLDLARALGLARLVAAAVRLQGVVAFYRGDHPTARRCFEEALQAARQAGSLESETNALNNLGAVAGDRGDLSSALDFFEQALAIKHEIGDRVGEGFALNNLGVVARDLGDYPTARKYLEQALAVFREVTHRQGEVYSLIDLASVTWNQGDSAGAHVYYVRALAIARDIDDRRGEGYALTGLGNCLTALQQWAEATAAFQQAVSLRQKLHQPHLAMESRAGSARAALAQGDLAQAQDFVANILAYLDEGNSLDGTDEPLRIYLTCYEVLHANQDKRAEEMLATAHRILQERASRISDDKTRRTFLESVPWHRQIAELAQGMASLA